jgi:hypothetical protein
MLHIFLDKNIPVLYLKSECKNKGGGQESPPGGNYIYNCHFFHFWIPLKSGLSVI